MLGTFPKWMWFLIFFFPVTAVVLGGYFLFINLFKPKDLNDPALTDSYN